MGQMQEFAWTSCRMLDISDPFNRHELHADLSIIQLEHCAEARGSETYFVKRTAGMSGPLLGLRTDAAYA